MKKDNDIPEKNTCRTGEGLLPTYFKKIGVAIILLTIIPAIVVRTMNIEFVQTQKELFRQLTMNFFIAGLFLVAWAKDKFEDERSMLIRLRAMGFAFICAVVSVIFYPVLSLLFGDTVKDLVSQELVTTMLVVYIIYFWLLKKIS